MLPKDKILQARYRIIRQLGQGGMGAVYEARDERLGSLVALKEILFELENLQSVKQQELVRHAFEREAKILASLHHEAFPRVIDHFFEKDRQFLVMELMQGDDLNELLEKRGKAFLLGDVLHWTEQLLDALDYLHTQNPPIYHRDIKPHNLKLTDRGKIILLDFGIAKGADNKTQTSITHQTFVAVTLNYSPIEQIFRVLDSTFRNVIESGHSEKVDNVSAQTIDGRSDLYALGATLYHLATGQVPVDAQKRTLENWAGSSEILVNPSEVNPDIPVEISAVLLKAMEIERENRYSTAKEMHEALRMAIAAIKGREEKTKQAAFLAEQVQLYKQQQLDAQKRRQVDAEEKRQSAASLQQAQVQRQIAEDRANEAERRLREGEFHQDLTESESITQRPTVNLSKVDLSLEATLHDYMVPGKGTVESPPTPNFALSETIGFQRGEAEEDFVPKEVDAVDGLTQTSYLNEVLPEKPKRETVTKPPPPVDTKKIIEKAAPNKLKFILILAGLVIVLFFIFGITAVVLFQFIPSANPPAKTDNRTTTTPTPIVSTTPTVSPTVSPTAESDIPVSNSPTPLPTVGTPEPTPDLPKATPTRSSTPTPRPTRTPSSKQPTPKPTKNPDCIFADDCR